MHICCVISSLQLGGAQRILVNLCQRWAEEGRRVTLITLSGADTDFYLLDDRIERVALGLAGESANFGAGVRSNLQRTAALRRTVVAANPDVVLSFIDSTNLLTLLATWRRDLPVVVAERTFPGAHAIGRVRGGLRRVAYRWSSAVVTQTEEGAAWIRSHTGAHRTEVIHNFLAPAFLQETALVERRKVVLGVGRLGREKGFDLLLEAWAQIGETRIGWRLRIVGQGPEKSNLGSLARKLGIDESVEFPGQTANIAEEYHAASVFVLPSRYEGFPNALIEALASGCLCVAFDCKTGPREIIQRVSSGTLVKPQDVGELARAIELSMTADCSAAARCRLVARTRSQFSIEESLRRWDQVLTTAVASQGKRRRKCERAWEGGNEL